MFFPLNVEVDQDTKPIGTWVLMALIASVFTVTMLLPDAQRLAVLYRFGFAPETWSVMTVFTHMFLHAGWLHVIGNLYFLWVFGRAAESEVGTARFIACYLLAGVIAVLTHAVVTIPAIADVQCVGASGAISGIMGVFLAVLPTASVRCALTISLHPHIVSVRAWVFIGVWFALQVINQKFLSDPSAGAGVAYAAHIGGFAFGWFAASGARLLGGMIAEFNAARRMAKHERAIATSSPAEVAAELDKFDVPAQQMVFVRHGVTPSKPGTVARWIDNTSPERWVDAATFFLRMHLAGREAELDAGAEVKGAKALTDLGHRNCAVSCLVDRLDGTEGPDRQMIYIGLAGILKEDPTTIAAAAHSLRSAIDVDPSSWFGKTAQEALIRLPTGNSGA
jgi:membrane associated rhomboid family serine protease